MSSEYRNVTQASPHTHCRCLHTPCHTQDSICFFIEDKKTKQRGVFTG